MKVIALLLAARPITLIATAVPVLLGTKLGSENFSNFNLVIFCCCLLSALCIQIATNYFNDAIDYIKGADRPERQGPKRMVATGMLSYKNMQLAAYSMILAATLFAIPLLINCGWPIIAIGLPSLYCTYAYTGRPLELAYRGLGELFVIIFFGLIAVTGSAFTQSGNFMPGALILGLQSGLLATSLIALNNLRDRAQDALANKRTLAVRLGEKFAKLEVSFCLIAPFLIEELINHALFSSLALQLTSLVALLCAVLTWCKPSKGQSKYLLTMAALTYLLFGISKLSL